MLIVVGLHVPVMPLSEVSGKPGAVEPAQIVSALPKLKTGVIFGFTVMVNVAVTAHKPVVGVKV